MSSFRTSLMSPYPPLIPGVETQLNVKLDRADHRPTVPLVCIMMPLSGGELLLKRRY